MLLPGLMTGGISKHYGNVTAFLCVMYTGPRGLKKYHLEPKRMQLVYPFVDKEPNMVLIEAMKGGNPRITVEKPLIVYEMPGVYTKDIRELYGDGR